MKSLSYKVLSLYFLLCAFSLLTLVSCGAKKPTINEEPDETASVQEDESKFTFQGVALEQFDEKGQPIWKVNAKQAKYTKEKQIGEAENPDGELYQDGKIVYKVTAQKADIRQDGKQLFLKGQIVATDPENGVVLRGNELEWRPQEDLLIVRNQLNGTHKQLQAVAQEAKVKTREQRIDFFGGVVAKSVEPNLQMRTEQLTWMIKQEKLIGDRAMQIDRFQDNKVIQRGRGDAASVFLKTEIVNITKNAFIELLDPLVQIASNSMTWNIKAETVKTNAPLKVVHRAENVTVSGNRGELKIPEKTVYVQGDAKGVGQKGQSIQSNNLTWYLDKQLVEASGNVVYAQTSPRFTFKGETATGNLQTENVVVKGGNSGDRVITEIIPQLNN
ncbi:MAG: LPS export ABC transporter periplasmic protein LptC [Richelia sp. RM2_1_2]|nr:LPS export ABC transporter periplasmic protein LptC [Richelia sp. RM1_1_1]NJO62345.1 LPS export ABC transporter periplasmic protein LptC [Richelia sp. RM2_1_2]